MKPIKFTTKVINNEYIAKETREIKFEIITKNEIIFSEGQFFNLIVEDKIMRAYSIASSSSKLPKFSLCVKIIKGGKGSGYIDSMKKGDEVLFMGPFGHFSKKSDKKIVMIATGTGIAPMKAICERLTEEEIKNNITLIFGVQNTEYASYNNYFINLEKKFSKFSYKLFVSRFEKEYKGNVGRVTKWIEEQSLENLKDTEFLLCGNPAMIKESKELLQNKGITKNNIIIEAY
jgi:NAD(P)H-flavin reductase